MFSSPKAASRHRSRARFAPRIDLLETRELLSTLTVTSSADDGDGTLRAQVAAAASGDTIVFDSALNGQTITLTSGPIAETGKDLTIDGPGSDMIAVSGNDASGIFGFSRSFAPGAPTITVSVSGLTLRDGNAPFQGGAIDSNGASLVINDVIFRDNQTANPGFGLGGAVNVMGVFTGGVPLVSVSITDSSFSNNSTPGVGGAFQSYFVDVTIADTVFEDNTAQLGAAVTVGSGALTITDTAFARNTRGGAVAYFAGFGLPANYTLTVSGSTFTENTGTRGGAIANVNGSLSVSDSTFTRNVVRDNNFAEGGAIHSSFGHVNIDGGRFEGNRAEGVQVALGGAVRLDGGLNNRIADTVFVGNEASGGDTNGGAVFATNFNAFGSPAPSLTLSGLTFEDNRAFGVAIPGFPGAANGGALYVNVEGQTTITDSRFTGNSARGADDIAGAQGGRAWGGAVFASANVSGAATLKIRDTDFVGNLARSGDSTALGGLSEGGALYVFVAPLTTIIGGTFIGNSAISGAGGASDESVVGAFGGAIRGGISLIDGTTFLGNSAIGSDAPAGREGGNAQGGAIWGNATLRHTRFGGNSVVGGKGGDGGGNGGSAEGGAISGNGSVASSSFIANSAQGGSGGAAVGSGVGGKGGDANGGAIRSGDLTVSSSHFLANNALGGRGGSARPSGTGGAGGQATGGAISFGLPNVTGGFLLVTDSAFIFNAATGGAGGAGRTKGAKGQGLGGAIAILNGTATIRRPYFFLNRASTSGNNIYGPYTP